ncbi:MAG: antibiotic biosynthesis monooxygenase, partial [Sulfurospirillum cavolei]|nr:antibiotic biosynthesis monooxygenase [Sulfurospirillum cavolei]
MSIIANTPNPPYYAVIFTSIRTEGDNGYHEMAQKMVELAANQPGFLGAESAREGIGITVSYWSDIESIQTWKAHYEHQETQKYGRE